MNPDFLKHLQQITAALRGGLVFNPLDELQKRATQYGEGVGTQLEHDRAVGAYSQAHPESQRARQEVMTNAAMLALGSIKPGERPSLVPAIKTLDGKIVDGITHAHAYMDAGIKEPLPPKNEGYVDLAKNKFYTRQAAEKLMKPFMSKSVQGQVTERSRQAGKDMGITTEDLNGKLYANRGTKADPPMTLADMERIMAKKNGGSALEARVPESTLLSRAQARRENVAKNWGDKRRPFEDRVADEQKIAANAAAFKARMHLESTPAVSPEEAQLNANVAAYQERKKAEGYLKSVLDKMGRKPLTPERLSQFNKNLGNVPDNGSKLPSDLQGKDFKNDVDKRIRGALWENTLKAARAAREAENTAALEANAKKYNLSKDSRAALARGDKQRATGVVQNGVSSFAPRLISALKENGGFTIDPSTGEPLTSGYSVGGGEKYGVLLKKPLADLKPSELQSFLSKNKKMLQPGQAWGGWVDNGHVYIEPADQVADLNAAQRLGNERGEKAIWDHANSSEIPLKAAKQETAATHAEEFANVLHKWDSVWDQYTQAGHEVSNLHTDRRASLLNALRFPDILKPK